MNTTTKRTASGIAAVAAVGIIVAGAWGIGSSIAAQPEPTPTPTETPITLTIPADTPADTIERRAAADAEQERIAAEAEAARIAAEQAAQAAAEEAARIAAEQEAARQSEQNSGGGGSVEPDPAPGCPAGSVEQAGGTCYWEFCFTLTIPDAAHPECDTAFRP